MRWFLVVPEGVVCGVRMGGFPFRARYATRVDVMYRNGQVLLSMPAGCFNYAWGENPVLAVRLSAGKV